MTVMLPSGFRDSSVISNGIPNAGFQLMGLGQLYQNCTVRVGAEAGMEMVWDRNPRWGPQTF